MAAGALASARAPPTGSAPPAPAPPLAPGPPALQPAIRLPGAYRNLSQSRLWPVLARASAQVRASDARLLRTVAQAAPQAVVQLARSLRRRLLRGAKEPRIGGTRLLPARSTLAWSSPFVDPPEPTQTAERPAAHRPRAPLATPVAGVTRAAPARSKGPRSGDQLPAAGAGDHVRLRPGAWRAACTPPLGTVQAGRRPRGSRRPPAPPGPPKGLSADTDAAPMQRSAPRRTALQAMLSLDPRNHG